MYWGIELRVLQFYAFAICVQAVVVMQHKNGKPKQKTDEKIYLIHSDELKFDHFGINPDAQIAKGHVHFRHQGAELWCDSAYFFSGIKLGKSLWKRAFPSGRYPFAYLEVCRL